MLTERCKKFVNCEGVVKKRPFFKSYTGSFPPSSIPVWTQHKHTFLKLGIYEETLKHTPSLYIVFKIISNKLIYQTYIEHSGVVTLGPVLLASGTTSTVQCYKVGNLRKENHNLISTTHAHMCECVYTPVAQAVGLGDNLPVQVILINVFTGPLMSTMFEVMHMDGQSSPY